MIDEVVASNLLVMAEPRANRINEVLNAADDLRTLDDKQMVVAAILFAVGLAKFTSLDLEDFVALSAHAYRNVDPEKKEKVTVADA